MYIKFQSLILLNLQIKQNLSASTEVTFYVHKNTQIDQTPMSCFQVNMLARILWKMNYLVPSNLPLTRGNSTNLSNFRNFNF